MKKVNNEEFYSSIQKGKHLVDFYATWCGPCKMLGMVLEKIDNEKIIDISKIDVDEELELAKEYKIYSVPTLILFKDGKEIKRISGFMDEDALKRWVIESEK